MSDLNEQLNGAIETIDNHSKITSELQKQISDLKTELERKSATLSELETAHEKLISHSNPKQKLHYLVDIKKKNNELETKNTELTQVCLIKSEI